MDRWGQSQGGELSGSWAGAEGRGGRPPGSLPGFQLLLAAGGGDGLSPPAPLPPSQSPECSPQTMKRVLAPLPAPPSLPQLFAWSPQRGEREGDEIMEQRGLETHFFPSPQWKTLGVLGEGRL